MFKNNSFLSMLQAFLSLPAQPVNASRSPGNNSINKIFDSMDNAARDLQDYLTTFYTSPFYIFPKKQLHRRYIC